MLISRVRLRPDAAEKKEFWEHVDSAYHMHSLIWDLFTDGPERKRDFIYRHDAVMEAKTYLKEKKGVLPREADIVQEAGFVWLAQKGEANGFSIRGEDI